MVEIRYLDQCDVYNGIINRWLIDCSFWNKGGPYVEPTIHSHTIVYHTPSTGVGNVHEVPFRGQTGVPVILLVDWALPSGTQGSFLFALLSPGLEIFAQAKSLWRIFWLVESQCLWFPRVQLEMICQIEWIKAKILMDTKTPHVYINRNKWKWKEYIENFWEVERD